MGQRGWRWWLSVRFQTETLPNIGSGSFTDDDRAYIDHDYFLELRQHEAVEGDIVVAALGDEGIPVDRACVVPASVTPAIVKADCFRVRLDTSSVFPGFVATYLSSTAGIANTSARARGVTRPRITLSMLGNVPIPLPPLVEQRAIAAFLDERTGRINALIEKKRRLLDLLAEKRRALITRAVTRGLNPTAPLKDTGIPWLGPIPAHWEVKRLKFAVRRIEQGWSPQCDSRPAEGEEWGVLKVGCVNGNHFEPSENKALPAELEPIRDYEIAEGDILISRANTKELLGSAALVEDVPPRLLLCDKLYRVQTGQEVTPRFLVRYLRSTTARFQYERDATGTSGSMQNIGQDTVLNLLFPLPPLDEQDGICAWLASGESQIDKATDAIDRGIARLIEYRSALITAAVTGQIDIAAAPAAIEAAA